MTARASCIYAFLFFAIWLGRGVLAQEQVVSDPDAFFSSPVKLGMTTEEVRESIGPPYYIAGSKDPQYIYRRYQQLMEHNTMFDIWLYQEPHNFMIYFMNGRVLRVVYVGGSSDPASLSLQKIYSTPAE